MNQKQRYWLFKRGGTYYIEDSVTGEQKSLCTSNRQEAEHILEISPNRVALSLGCRIVRLRTK